MKYLLDTATFLWAAADLQDQLSPTALAILADSENELCLSAVSTWEIAIKYSTGKLKILENPDQLIPDLILKMNLQILSINYQHTLTVIHLPWHHRDPFDRLLVCQANVEDLPILTPDAIFKKYKVKTVW